MSLPKLTLSQVWGLFPHLKETARRNGAKGGRKAARSMTRDQRAARARHAAMALSPKERSERGRRAVNIRWARVRAARRKAKAAQDTT